MGILFNTSTWRAPLQLIDCWLPAPSLRQTHAANEPRLTRAVQRFARAGWLGRPAGAPAPEFPAPTRSSARKTGAVRVLRQAEPAQVRPGNGVRLVISGRINDVCAELDRLADQEENQAAARVA